MNEVPITDGARQFFATLPSPRCQVLAEAMEQFIIDALMHGTPDQRMGAQLWMRVRVSPIPARERE